MDQSVIKRRISAIIILSMIVLFCIFVGVIFQIIKIKQLEKQKTNQEQYLQTLDTQIASLSKNDNMQLNNDVVTIRINL